MRSWISSVLRLFVSSPSVSSLSVSSSSGSHSPVAPAEAVLPVAGSEIEALEGRRLCASGLAYGINVNQLSSSNYSDIVGMLKNTGTRTVRLFLGINNYSHNESGLFKYVRRIKAEGFDTMLTVDPKRGMGSDATVQSYFSWIAGELGGSVDRWQVGNEVERKFGDLSTYVNDVLAPAAAGLHSHGEKVVSGSVSWDPADIAELVDAGMLRYVDFVGYHPYRNSVADLQKCVAKVKDLVGGKPLVASEWNVRGDEGDKAAWNEEIKEFCPTIRDNFYAAYYYAAVKTGTLAGPGGVLTSGGDPNGAFYSTYKGLKNDFSDGGTITPTPTPAPTDPTDNDPVANPSTGNNYPDSAGTPVVAGFNIFDAITGKMIRSNVSGTQTISLSGLAHRQIQVRALVTSNTKSVTFGFTGKVKRTENSAPYTAFADSKGQASSWYAARGTYTLTAAASSADYAKGKTGAALSLILKFV